MKEETFTRFSSLQRRYTNFQKVYVLKKVPFPKLNARSIFKIIYLKKGDGMSAKNWIVKMPCQDSFLWKIRDSFLTCVDYRQPLTARQSYVKLLFSLEDCIFTNVKTALQVIIKTGHHSYQCVPLCVLMTKSKVHTDAINKCFYCGKSSPLTSWQIDHFCWRHQKIGYNA